MEDIHHAGLRTILGLQSGQFLESVFRYETCAVKRIDAHGKGDALPGQERLWHGEVEHDFSFEIDDDDTETMQFASNEKFSVTHDVPGP
jgi:hypothetical protein